MTNEELEEMKEKAIEYFKFHRKIFCEDHLKICPKDSIAYQATLKEKEFYDMAIKALEQESALDKIEEEIKDTLYVDSLIFTELIDFKNGKIDADDVIEEFNRVTRLEILRIIDKYRTESEKV